MFRRTKFLTGLPVNDTGLKDVTWLAPEGREMTEADWHAPNARVLGARLFHPRTATSGGSTDDDLFVILVSSRDTPVRFKLPVPRRSGWRTMFDTARADADLATQLFTGGQAYPMLAQSFVLLQDA